MTHGHICNKDGANPTLMLFNDFSLRIKALVSFLVGFFAGVIAKQGHDGWCDSKARA